MLEALRLPFMQRALVAGVLVGLLASYYGVFVVQRRLSFLGIGLSHAAFGGVALGLLLHINPMWVAVPFTVAVALGINAITARGHVAGDTAIGVLFAVAVALGIVFLSLRQSYTADAFAYLFGSILAVQPADLWVMGGLALVTIAAVPLWGRWAYATFDRDLARADRVPVGWDDAVLVTLLAITVVAAVKVVGIILAAAFLVIPAATARLLARTFRGMTSLAMGIGAITAVGGLLASYVLDMPSGATIILAQAVLFAVALSAARA
jgi:zinc transport system permease protein